MTGQNPEKATWPARGLNAEDWTAPDRVSRERKKLKIKIKTIRELSFCCQQIIRQWACITGRRCCHLLLIDVFWNLYHGAFEFSYARVCSSCELEGMQLSFSRLSDADPDLVLQYMKYPNMD